MEEGTARLDEQRYGAESSCVLKQVTWRVLIWLSRIPGLLSRLTDRLSSVTWFTNVGMRDRTDVVFVGSWDEAVKSCSLSDWENVTHEAANQLRERIVEIDKARLNRWNDIVALVKPFAEALVHDKAAPIAERESLPGSFLKAVRWDILHLCMETEYADIVPPAFYSALALYYLNGHFSCGFAGAFPEGKWIIY